MKPVSPWWGAIPALLASTPAQAQIDLRAVDASNRVPTVFLEDQLEVEVDLDRPEGSFAGALDVRIRVSSDGTLDPADPIAFTSSIALSSTTTVFTVRGPVPALEGPFFIVAELDPANLIAETDETNNDVVGAPLTIVGGDLEVLRAIPDGPGQAFVGEPFGYRIEWRNRGPSVVSDASLTVDFRASGSPSIRVLETVPERLGVNSSRVLSETFVVPAGTATGTAELTARISTPDPVDPEPLNDVKVLSFPVRAPVPDWRGEIISTSTAVEAGGRLTVNRVVENAGLVDAPPTEILYVLSEDEDLRPSDPRLGRFSVPALAVDAIDVRSDAITIPLTATPGSFRLGFLIDPDEAVEEVDEANAVMGPRVEVFPPDLRIATESLPLARLGRPYDVALIAVGGTSPAYRWRLLSGSAPGIELDGDAGILSGVPTTTGRFPLELEVRSGTARAERTLDLRVVEGAVELELDDLELPVGVIGRPYETRLVPRGGVDPFVWTALTPPPSGLDLESDGRVRGTVTETSTGTFGFDLRVEDALGATATAAASLTIVEVNQGVTLLVDPLPIAVVGRRYCDPDPVQLRAVGEFPPFVFSSAFPPVGLELTPDGRLCGSPERVGTSTFTVNVRDELGFVDDGVFRLRVDSDDSVRIATPELPSAEVGQPYEAEVRAEGGQPPYRFDVSVGRLPPGFALEPGGRIAGTSTVSDRFVFAVRATDARGASGQAGFGIVVFQTGPGDDGCDCRTSGRGPAPWALLIAGGAWWLVRRRRRR